jgi:hypothetical protein
MSNDVVGKPNCKGTNKGGVGNKCTSEILTCRFVSRSSVIEKSDQTIRKRRPDFAISVEIFKL